jgi:hypothetical protein
MIIFKTKVIVIIPLLIYNPPMAVRDEVNCGNCAFNKLTLPARNIPWEKAAGSYGRCMGIDPLEYGDRQIVIETRANEHPSEILEHQPILVTNFPNVAIRLLRANCFQSKEIETE